MDSGGTWRLGHRPALDGVRGIAILLVMLCHSAVPHFWGGGAMGVTLFFTLSGFLITTLLLEEHTDTGRISLKRFYIRRARRLGPALVASTAVIAVLGVATGAAWFFTGWSVVPVLLYVANWPLAMGAAPNALGGTWSLAVEEQFYILWPLAVIVAVRRGLDKVVVLAAAVLVSSLAIRVLLYVDGSPAHEVYYRTDTTASALAAGALLALAAQLVPLRRMAIPVGAGVAVLVAVAFLDTEVRGWWFTAPVAATLAGVAILHRSITDPPTWLSQRVLRWFGARSYALYLIHGPLAWVLRERTDLAWPVLLVVVFATSCLLAEASWRYVERPFRRPAQTTEKSSKSVLAVLPKA